MKIKNITILRDDINKDNVISCNFNYSSIVNNDTENTSDELINTTAIVLFDMFKRQKGDNRYEEKS